MEGGNWLWYLIVDFIFISLRTKDVTNLFMCLLDIHFIHIQYSFINEVFNEGLFGPRNSANLLETQKTHKGNL